MKVENEKMEDGKMKDVVPTRMEERRTQGEDEAGETQAAGRSRRKSTRERGDISKLRTTQPDDDYSAGSTPPKTKSKDPACKGHFVASRWPKATDE